MENDNQSSQEEFFLMQLQQPCKDVTIEVVDAQNRGHGILSSHVSYVIRVKQLNLNFQRRYREFYSLREVLTARWPGVLIPCLPRKHLSGSTSIKVVSERIKALTYFLNCIAKEKYLYESDEFQIFLKSTVTDVTDQYEKLPRLTFDQRLIRYQMAFSFIKVAEQQQQLIKLKQIDIVNPFLRQMKDNKIKLVNIKKEAGLLAQKKEQYIKNLRILYNQSLPDLQKHFQSTYPSFASILNAKQNQKMVHLAGEIKIDKSANAYWMLYQILKLEKLETEAAIQAIEGQINVEKEEERIKKKVASNQEQLSDIKNKKFSLRQLFGGSSEEMISKIEKQNQTFRKELLAIDQYVLFTIQIVCLKLIPEFRSKRIRLWKSIWTRFSQKQIQQMKFMKQFYEPVLSI